MPNGLRNAPQAARLSTPFSTAAFGRSASDRASTVSRSRRLGRPSLAPSAAEEVDQRSPLALAQTAERLRVRDPALSEHAPRFDRTHLRQEQEQIEYFRRLRELGWAGEDPRQLDLPGGEIALQLGSR